MASAMEQIRLAVGELEQGNDQACISTLQTLLLQPQLPFFWRIHALALLAHSEDSWLEAKVSASFRVQGWDPSPNLGGTSLIMI